MGNRFGLKDLFLFALLSLLIVVVLLGMKQYDRQHDILDAIQQQTTQQTKELAQISRTLKQGIRATVAAAPTTLPSAGDPATDPFVRIKEARARPDYAPGDTCVRSISNIEKITPLVSTDRYAQDIQAYVLETLATRDPVTLGWVPVLARSFETSADGLVLTFQIRPEATFSDGQRVTADDVIFTFEFIMNPQVEAPRQRAYYQKIQSVEKVGDNGVAFHFKESYFKSMDVAGLMPILSKSFYGKFTPEQFNKMPGLLFGSGPYKLADPTSWAPGKPLQFVRNERYWGAPPAIDRLVFKEFGSDLPKITDFRNGDSDLLRDLFPEQYKELLKDAKLVARTQHFEYESPTSGYRYIAWNQRRNGKPTRFADKRVRQALTMLTDRQWIVSDLSMGLAVALTGPFPPSSKQYDPTVKAWPYDPQRAKALLKEAGFEDRDGDGVLKGPDGVPFKFQLTYPAGNAAYQQMVLYLKDSYARAGITIDPNPLDWSVFSQKLKGRDFDAISLGWGTNIESDLYQAFHSDQIKDQGDNMCSYSNPDLDKVIEEARRTVDEPKRMALWHKAHQIIHEDQPYTFLVARKELAFMDGRFKNVQVVPTGLNDLSEWYVPTEDQKRIQ
jgi:peptide/nickel transport system substrate-binding protein